MAGHSQFKNIMHRKGRQDAARSKLFSRLSKEITVAVKLGGGTTDPDMNPRLRLAIQNAKGQSMPKDNIQRAITKADGGADDASYEEVTMEGYGPGGVAILAREHGVPFFVVAPRSTFDASLASGAEIPIEERSAEEVTCGFGQRTAPEGVQVYSPAFDVTPARLVTAIVTEVGVIEEPTKERVGAHLGL